MRRAPNGSITFEVVAEDVEFLRNITWERGEVRQACQAVQSELLTDTPAEGEKAHSQVWKVTLECADANSGKSTTGDVNVLVSEHEQAWKFDLVLFTQENQNDKQK